MTIELSSFLKEIADELGRYDGDHQLPVDRNANLYARVTLCAELAAKMEMELLGFRLLESDREGRAYMEGQAIKVLNKPVSSHDGKVIRPDFGSRK
ncbi:hypothetical protein [Brucella anthropi]|uniref:hypothetical protein n=1 Tax=Brucella anthropi TaxID=529 RepID=UPI00235F428A|nr:hypothetical protein [Brucella anthropi]